MSLYSPDKKSEIALEVWPFLRNGTLHADYMLSFQETSKGEPTNPAIIRWSDGQRVSPDGWDGDTQVRVDGVLVYRPGYIPGSVAPNVSVLNKYFAQAGETQTAAEKYRATKAKKALIQKIALGVIFLVILWLGGRLIRKKL